MTAASHSGAGSRCVLHLDVDAFYCACEERRRPELRGKPLAVTQFNSGGFVAVSEAARQSGVRKGDGIGAGGQEALAFYKDRPEALMAAVRRRCPNLTVLPMDTTFYRHCSAELFDIIVSAPCWTASTAPTVEKASIDDFYVDCSEEVWYRNQRWCEGAGAPGATGQPASKQPRLSQELDVADVEELWDQEGGCGSSGVESPTSDDGPSGSGLIADPAAAECPTFFDVVSIYSSAATSAAAAQPYTPQQSVIGPGQDSGPALVACTIAHELRDHVRRASGGMTLSCGIGTSKLLARLVSKRPKQPDSQTMLLPHQVDGLLAVCPLKAVPGLKGALGRRIQEKFEPHSNEQSTSSAQQQLCLSSLADLPIDQVNRCSPRSSRQFSYQKMSNSMPETPLIDDTSQQLSNS